MDPLDSKKRYLQELLKKVSGGAGEDLRTKYAPPPPAAPEPTPTVPAAPSDPLAGIDADALEGLIARKPEPNSGRVSMDAKHVLTTEGYDPNRKDAYGKPHPKDERGHQYTEEGLKRLRAADPEWPDRERALKASVRDEETD